MRKLPEYDPLEAPDQVASQLGTPTPPADPDAHYDNLEVPKPCTRHTKLKFLLNPCDIDRHPSLQPVGDWLASWASHCPCCNSARVLIAGSLGFGAGLLVSLL